MFSHNHLPPSNLTYQRIYLFVSAVNRNVEVATMGKEGFIQTSDVVPTEDQHWGNTGGGGSPVCTQSTPSLCLWNSWLVESSDRNQTPYIPVSQKELLLLLTDLPKLLGTHFGFLFISPFEITSCVVYYLLWKRIHFICSPSTFVSLPPPCFPPHHQPQLLTGLLRNAQPAWGMWGGGYGGGDSLLSSAI